MASYKISAEEVIRALQDQNIESAAGELGLTGNQAFQYPLKYTGKLKNPEQFENIIVRNKDGQLLRVKDVADVELGSIIYSVSSEIDKKPAALISVNQTPGSKAQQIIKDVKDKMEAASADLPPGVEITYVKDDSASLSASISKVVSTLFEAFILVFLVVFVFLQKFRYTIIPAMAVPISIIGAFLFMYLFGFSINILTLFALVLAIGTVVDDPIVVVEAVHAKMEGGETNPKKATKDAMKEITPAIISITLVLMAVFLPVSFMGGMSGIFFRQFGITIAAAVFISAIVALTLSPSMCARLFKIQPPKEGKKKRKNILTGFFNWFNRVFDKATAKYKSSLNFFTRKKNRWISVAIVVGCSGILFGLLKVLPSTFVPDEDSGNIMGIISLPPGSSMERTDLMLLQVIDIRDEIPEVQNTVSLSGMSMMNGEGSSYGTVLLKLKPWDERERTAQQITELL
jgi:HAE1 family hydrophobic/amphiphilic exporter-1